MTTEVSIMNKHAVALAADSAVTISTNSGDGPKIYNSVNKLFTLSKYQPVGVMVYGSASFMGIPWETIIKEYRKNLSNNNYKLLTEYADDFIENIKKLNKENDELNYLEKLHIKNFLLEITSVVEKSIQEVADTIVGEESDSASAEKRLEEQKSTIVDGAVKQLEDALSNVDELESMAGNHATDVIEKYKDSYLEIWKNVFSDLSVSQQQEEKIFGLLIKSISKNYFFSKNDSGIVVSGFGLDEFFPVMVEYNFEGFMFGKLKYKKGQTTEINNSCGAIVRPFAQGDSINTFMQ